GATVPTWVRAPRRCLGRNGERLQEQAVQGVEGNGLSHAGESFHTMQQEVADPEAAGSKGAELAPPAGQHAAGGKNEWRGPRHALLPSRRWNARGWGPCPWR